jgi:hypothetical protein
MIDACFGDNNYLAVTVFHKNGSYIDAIACR